jgi:hypothetical protein
MLKYSILRRIYLWTSYLSCRSRSYFTTVSHSVSQSVSQSWYRAPLWDLRPDIISCRNVTVWNLLSCFCGAPSLTRGREEEEEEEEVTLRLTVSQSVSQYVLVSSTLVGHATRYYFLSECCYLKFAVLYLLDALSDERMGLEFEV